MIDLDEALANPVSVFKSPKFLLEAQQISHEDKLRILENWQQQLVQKQQATDESMAPPEGKSSDVGDELQQVGDAIKAIKR